MILENKTRETPMQPLNIKVEAYKFKTKYLPMIIGYKIEVINSKLEMRRERDLDKRKKEPRIQFIDRALRKGEEAHYRCVECGQYILQDLVCTHKCKISALLSFDMRVKYETRKKYLSLIERYLN